MTEFVQTHTIARPAGEKPAWMQAAYDELRYANPKSFSALSLGCPNPDCGVPAGQMCTLMKGKGKAKGQPRVCPERVQAALTAMRDGELDELA